MITPAPTVDPNKRQLWALPTPSVTNTSGLCKSFTLPSGGTLVIDPTSSIVLSSNIVYQPACSSDPAFIGLADNGTLPIDGYRDPFYASVTPLVYVVALTTTMAWLLMITLLLLPASYNGPSSRPLVQAWRRGDSILSLFNSRSSPFPLGNRPFLQRLAALMVVVALTTVTADTFRHAQEQYESGYSDAMSLRDQVSESKEVRVIRVISDLFLWLAQIQTLVRLFPRRKEKLVIKWVGFVLILLDIIFSCLNSFYINRANYDSRPRSYKDAISALSYLFQFALNLLYAAWVVYFVMTKRRYALYHHMMPEICIVASISLLSILIPVVFFLVDIFKGDVSAWGDYFRWVGSAAASIVVWEWVERIEFLEREEKKDGILGREIFEEDDIGDDFTPRSSNRDSVVHGEKRSGFGQRLQRARAKYGDVENVLRRVALQTRPQQSAGTKNSAAARVQQTVGARRRQQNRPAAAARDSHNSIIVPPQAASPFDREDTISPGSTVYAIHYHPTTQTPPTVDAPTPSPAHHPTPLRHKASGDMPNPPLGTQYHDITEPVTIARLHNGGRYSSGVSWRWPMGLFHASRQSPPAEVKNALSQSQNLHLAPTARDGSFLSRAMGRTQMKKDEKDRKAFLGQCQPTVILPPSHGNQPWTPESIRRVANQSTVTSNMTGHQPQEEELISPGVLSASHDFATHNALTERTPTSGGNLSGSTALETAPPERQVQDMPNGRHQSSTQPNAAASAGDGEVDAS